MVLSQRAALENMSKVLRAAGSGLEHIVKANIYLTDMANFGPMNEIYAQVGPVIRILCYDSTAADTTVFVCSSSTKTLCLRGYAFLRSFLGDVKHLIAASFSLDRHALA